MSCLGIWYFQYSPSPTYLLDDSNSELSLSLPKKTVQRFCWRDEKLEFLIKYLASVKADYEFKRLDFKSDLVKSYCNVRAKMAEIYDKNDFGPVEETSMRDCMTTADIVKRKLILSEKKLIKNSYLHIKENVRNVRQDYQNAAVESRWSKSAKFVHDYWDLLKEIWSDSPATNCIKNARCSIEDAHPIEKESGGSQEPIEEVNYAEDGEILDNWSNDLEAVQETKVHDIIALT